MQAAARSHPVRIVARLASSPPTPHLPFQQRSPAGSYVRAESVAGATTLTQVAHKAPLRLTPTRSASAGAVGANAVSIGNYGGGILGGDVLPLKLDVGTDAALSVVTQGATRVYRTKPDGEASEVLTDACVHSGGLLAWVPDQVVPFSGSRLKQETSFTLADGASVVAVDWVGAGRVANGERWVMDSLTSTSSFRRVGAPAPFLVDALSLSQSSAALPAAVGPFDAHVSVVAIGPQAAGVGAALRTAAAALAARRGARAVAHPEAGVPTLDSPAVMGVSDVSAAAGEPATVARIAAVSTDDVYRVLHYALKDLVPALGDAPYGLRVHARGTGEETPLEPRGAAKPYNPTRVAMNPLAGLTHAQLASLSMLTDSALPTGGFAHSGGVEALSQTKVLDWFGGAGAAIHAIATTTAAAVHVQQSPFLASAYNGGDAEWAAANSLLGAHLAGNAAASRASAQQGNALLRAVGHWVPQADVPREGHLAPAMGLAATLLDLPLEAVVAAFLFSTVRDTLSASVRLNLLGPLEAVGVQADVLSGVAASIDLVPGGVDTAANIAPLLDTVQCSHDVLDARLFHT